METAYPLNSDNYLTVTWPEWLFWGGLWLTMQPLTWLVLAIQWMMDQCDEDSVKIAQFKKNLLDYVEGPGDKTIDELRALIRNADVRPEFLEKLNLLLSVPEFRPHIREILAGANLQIINSEKIAHIFQGKFPRRSSHNYLSDQSWGLSDRIINHILIWNDEDGTFRMQLENSAFGDSILSSILHWVNDWLKHLATGKQIGPFGASAHLDSKPIRILISS